MKRSKKKLAITGLLVGALVIPTAASAAYSKGFTYNIDTRIVGTTEFDLANKSTSITSSANTYFQGNVTSYKADYTISLVKSGITQSTQKYSADGSSVTKSYGVRAAGNHTVTINKSTRNLVGERVIGKGTVKQ